MKKKKYIDVDEVKLLILNYIRSIQMNDYGTDNGIPQLWSIMKQIDKMPTVDRTKALEEMRR